MKLDLDAKANQTQIGLLIGKSQQAVSKLASKADVKSDATNGEMIRAIFERLTEEAAGRGGEYQQELTKARIRAENGKADLAEMSIREKAGLLVLAEEIEPSLLRMVTAARQELLTLPGKFASDMKMLHGIDIDESLVTERIHDSLKHLATSLQESDAGDDGEGDEIVVAAATDDDDGVGG
jgi:phage terminase Nu1 subunit (DNA packaging protein)